MLNFGFMKSESKHPLKYLFYFHDISDRMHISTGRKVSKG